MLKLDIERIVEEQEENVGDSKVSKDITRVVKLADKLVQNLKKNTDDLLTALKELKDLGKNSDER